jgi:hypothetical protein
MVVCADRCRLVSTRRAALLGGIAALAGSPVLASTRTYRHLFHIERSKNANIVQYDAVEEGSGRLDSKAPVVAYWIMRAEDGRRESLTFLERSAYGFDVRPEPGGSWLVKLKSLPDRTLRVLLWRGRWVAQAVIRGRSAVLERVFVEADDSGLVPSVRWIDLFGVDMVTGALLTERLRPG